MRNYRHKMSPPSPTAQGDVVGTMSGDGSGVMIVIEPGGAVMIPVTPQYEIDEFGQHGAEMKAVKGHGKHGKLYKAGRP